MAEVGRVEFEAAVERLRMKMRHAAAEIAAEMGAQLDPDAIDRQAATDFDEACREILMFGCDLWPADDDKPGDVEGSNVVPFVNKAARGTLRSFARGIGTAARVSGAVVGTTLVAAAFTKPVEMPGLKTVVHRAYLNNAPEEEIRFFEVNGQFFQVKAQRRPGEPATVLHVVGLAETTKEIALADDGDQIMPFPVMRKWGAR